MNIKDIKKIEFKRKYTYIHMKSGTVYKVLSNTLSMDISIHYGYPKIGILGG